MRDEGTYDGKVSFYVVTLDTPQAEAELKRWPGLGSHGLVGATYQGEMKVMIPGHQFSKADVVAKVDELLKLTGKPGGPAP